ncbi:biotin--[acetyl-CoA-carboxylase] ligase [Magnetovibrio sp.]|uniref:biotin--[acetyl-CoA-carboxylase] ligase n=1 Tax=Magnetovibrio sp. TaxID=2024836 RepID=UPI002F92B5D3
MTTASSLQLPSPYVLVELECVDSTNAEAKRLAEQGAPDLTLVWAKRQTAGRGRRGREWVSVEGNLYFSIILRMPYAMRVMTQLSFVAANAVADAVQVVCPSGTFVNVKWPNDVLVEGAKISGILMEAQPAFEADQFEWLVLGIGVNVATHPVVEDGGFPATSLAAQGVLGEGLDVALLLDTLAKRFLAGVATWRNLGFGPIRRHWLARARGVGGPVTVRLPNETLEGIFGALDEDGALVLHRDGHPNRLITAGDVFIPSIPREL